MLITILAAGTRGDIQPYIALGIELKKADHHVRIATAAKIIINCVEAKRV